MPVLSGLTPPGLNLPEEREEPFAFGGAGLIPTPQARGPGGGGSRPAPFFQVRVHQLPVNDPVHVILRADGWGKDAESARAGLGRRRIGAAREERMEGDVSERLQPWLPRPETKQHRAGRRQPALLGLGWCYSRANPGPGVSLWPWERPPLVPVCRPEPCSACRAAPRPCFLCVWGPVRPSHLVPLRSPRVASACQPSSLASGLFSPLCPLQAPTSPSRRRPCAPGRLTRKAKAPGCPLSGPPRMGPRLVEAGAAPCWRLVVLQPRRFLSEAAPLPPVS